MGKLSRHNHRELGTASVRWRASAILALFLLPDVPVCLAETFGAQQAPPGAPSAQRAQPTLPPPNQPPTISLSPAVIMAKGSHGQGITEQLTLSNFTSNTLSFDLVAQDVATKNGKRVFVPAGETPGSIAATAVFSPQQLVVKPNTGASARVTFTIPQKTDLRAVAAIFRGTGITATKGSVGMVASLGTLFVFTLSEDLKVEASAITVTPQTSASNLGFEQWLTNSGSEPLMPDGVAAVLDGGGTLVGKSAFQPQRLLPGEKLLFKTPYPAQLDPGHYRVLVSFQYEGRNLTSSQDFTVQ